MAKPRVPSTERSHQTRLAGLLRLMIRLVTGKLELNQNIYIFAPLSLSKE